MTAREVVDDVDEEARRQVVDDRVARVLQHVQSDRLAGEGKPRYIEGS